MPLNNRQIRNAKPKDKAYKLTDGNSLLHEQNLYPDTIERAYIETDGVLKSVLYLDMI